MSLFVRVGRVCPPHLVLPLTVEPTKPRLCHDARFLNLWMVDVPFKVDSLVHLPRNVGRESYQTIVDNKSGYDHSLLSEKSPTYFGIQWGGWYFLYNTLPFGWKISPFIYHSTGLVATNFFRSLGIPCFLYIDDRPMANFKWISTVVLTPTCGHGMKETWRLPIQPCFWLPIIYFNWAIL